MFLGTHKFSVRWIRFCRYQSFARLDSLQALVQYNFLVPVLIQFFRYGNLSNLTLLYNWKNKPTDIMIIILHDSKKEWLPYGWQFYILYFPPKIFILFYFIYSSKWAEMFHHIYQNSLWKICDMSSDAYFLLTIKKFTDCEE